MPVNSSPSATRPAAIILGAGLMGRWHAHSLHRLGISIQAIADPDLTRSGELARRFGGQAADDPIVALGQGDRSVVHVCSPPEKHDRQIRAALEHGHSVLVEKPFASSVSLTRELLSVADKKGLLIGSVHQFPFQDGMIRFQENRSSLGKLTSARMVICSAGAEGRDDETRHRVATEITPHVVSVHNALNPSDSEDSSWRTDVSSPGEIRLERQDGDFLFQATISMSSRPIRNQVEVFGTRGTAFINLFHGFVRLEKSATNRFNKAVQPIRSGAHQMLSTVSCLAKRALTREPAYPGLRRLIAEFYSATMDEKSSPISAAEILESAEVMEQLHHAGSTPLD